MGIHVNSGGIDKKLDKILAMLTQVLQKEEQMSAALDALTAQVAATTTVEQSAITLIQGIAAQLAALVAAGTVTPAQLTALSDQLNASATA